MRVVRPTVVIAAILACLEALVAASSQPPSLLAKLPSRSLKGQHGSRGMVVASASHPAGGEEPLLMGPIPVLWALGSTAVQSIRGVLGGSPPAAAEGEVSSSKRSSGDKRAAAVAQPAGQSSSSSKAGAVSAKKGDDVLEGGNRVLEQNLEKKLWDACRWGETRKVQELIEKVRHILTPPLPASPRSCHHFIATPPPPPPPPPPSAPIHPLQLHLYLYNIHHFALRPKLPLLSVRAGSRRWST